MVRELSVDGIRGSRWAHVPHMAEALRESKAKVRGQWVRSKHLPLEDLRRGESPFWSLLEWEGQIVGNAAPTFQELPPPRPVEGVGYYRCLAQQGTWLCLLQGQTE